MLAFPIRLPSLGPAPAGSGKYKATLTALHAKVETIKDSTYSVEMSLNFTAGAENYSSFFKQPFGVGKTAETFARVLKEYNEKAAKSFPYMARVPSVRFVLTEKGDAGQFVVNVPPLANLYVDSQMFWEIIGITSTYYDHFGPVTFEGTTTPVMVDGFDNHLGTEARIVRGRVMPLQEPLDLLHDKLSLLGVSIDQPRMEVSFAQDRVPFKLRQPQPVTHEGLAEGLNHVIGDGLKILNLDPTTVVASLQDKELILQSKGWQGANMELSVTITSEDLAEYLQMEEKTLKFDLHAAQTHVLHPREVSTEEEPLAPYFPLSIVAVGGSGGARKII